MRIITWNVRHGGGDRARSFAEQLVSLSPDIAIITEYRNGPTGAHIKHVMERAGLFYFSDVSTPARLNTVLLCSRTPFEERQLDSLGDEAHRCSWVRVEGINILGFYFPQNREKANVFDAICGLDSGVLVEQSLLIGDFNTGRHFVDEREKTFHCTEYFDRLEGLGWIDTWRSRNETAREFSWFSNVGNGFRLDHAFASPRLNMRIESVGYNHEVRKAGLSDHSAMIVDVGKG
ncbi:endonuclease/exonuclease/phosphatase family protein [Woeseia oceani]|uniref:Endonuclease/exonuclease/phosphatase domain-containing protein n=1 Tax=Woeseia oceani TaxID=1548547 RepID=A0A193LFY1_9GAMM|nr:endonuclease/exonuclease/phosphatase family protein [Woeseia oceani]ANO51373.1 hypothetical protein BA177_09330 [Woeseia oceani]